MTPTSAPGVVAPRRLTYVRLSDLRPAVLTPRRHLIPGLVASLERYGWTAPVLVDERTSRLAAGHGRLAAAVEMRSRALPPPGGVLVDDDGEWLIPVVRGWESRSDAEAAAYLVADNKLTEGASWDARGLAELLEQVHADDAELFDEMGFTDAEMDALFRAAAGDAAGSPDDPGAPPAVPTEPGDRAAGGSVAPVQCPSCSFIFTPGGA